MISCWIKNTDSLESNHRCVAWPGILVFV